METERFITSTMNKKDSANDETLRPKKFSDFPGQESVKERLAKVDNSQKLQGEKQRTRFEVEFRAGSDSERYRPRDLDLALVI